MFLIQYCKKCFVNAEDINHISITEGKVEFSLRGETGSCFVVDKCMEENFVNSLQALNDNIHNVESFYEREVNAK